MDFATDLPWPFCLTWCDDIDVTTLVSALRAVPTDDDEEGRAAIVAPPRNGWTEILELTASGFSLTAQIIALSQNSRRVLTVFWDIDGNNSVTYAVGGRILVRFMPVMFDPITAMFNVNDPSHRQGLAPDAIDPHLEGLVFESGSLVRHQSGDTPGEESNDGIPVREVWQESCVRIGERLTGNPFDLNRFFQPDVRLLRIDYDALYEEYGDPYCES
ncbi:hypothetical protein [Acrocarpospora catenulata]|uniref:hypothetical protein n=1 Tax=Acrocarpospora catenulata TaxID=2836182 RepID=UPI001BD99711|nr:hypothetical protein [Acrocarpospora catenulata]